MNGVGVFGTLGIGRHAFVEVGFDSYQSAPGDAEMQDRTSLATTAAAGLRMFPDFVLTPNVHAGGGVEWTRVDQPGSRAQGAYPIGFFGVGLEANVLQSLKAGANLRFLGMAHPREAGETEPPPGGRETRPPGMEMQLASQAQFFVRYVL